MRKSFIAVIILSILSVVAPLSFAIPVEISYQGYLTDIGGVPISGTINMTFRLYDHATGSQPINLKWESLPMSVITNDGVYSVILGENEANPIDPAIFASQLWLGIEVETDGEMAPRQKLTSVAYSMNAQTAQSAQTAESVPWSAVSDKPADFNDSVDNDTLGGLQCTIDQIVKWNGSAWVCADNAPQGSAPTAPTGVTAAAGDVQVTISWSPVAGAVAYNIYWNATGEVTTSDNAIISAPSPYVHSNLTNSTVYYYMITAINENGESSPSVEVSAMPRVPFSQIVQKITAGDAQTNDYFGKSVSIDGNYAIVGAYGEDGGTGNPLPQAGAAYIFHRTGTNTWDAGTGIVAPDRQATDMFGHSVSISGNYAIIGAYGEDSRGTDAGAAYIFHRTGTNTWDGGTKIVAPDAQINDYFGTIVSISGDYAVVGAYGEDGGTGNPLPQAGAAYIFHRTGTNTWDAGTKVVASDSQASDYFGWAVSISGDYAVIGAYGEDSEDAEAGAAYIFHRTGTNTWDAGTKIIAPDSQASDYFGWAASISGDFAVVGAPNEDGGEGDPSPDAGAAYIFHRTGTNTWDTGTIKGHGLADGKYGTSVSISGDYVIVGAYREDGGGTDAGAAYIFHRTGTATNTWGLLKKIFAPDAQANDYFGTTVSISGDHAVVGAPNEDGGDGDPIPGAGAAYIY